MAQVESKSLGKRRPSPELLKLFLGKFQNHLSSIAVILEILLLDWFTMIPEFLLLLKSITNSFSWSSFSTICNLVQISSRGKKTWNHIDLDQAIGIIVTMLFPMILFLFKWNLHHLHPVHYPLHLPMKCCVVAMKLLAVVPHSNFFLTYTCRLMMKLMNLFNVSWLCRSFAEFNAKLNARMSKFVSNLKAS